MNMSIQWIRNHIFHPFIWSLCNDRRGISQVFCQVGALRNVSQHSKENACTGVFFILNMVAGVQPQSNFMEKKALAFLFSWQLCEIFKNKFLSVDQIFVGNLIIHNFFSETSTRFLYFMLRLHLYTYSKVPNDRAPPLIIFGKIFRTPPLLLEPPRLLIFDY